MFCCLFLFIFFLFLKPCLLSACESVPVCKQHGSLRFSIVCCRVFLPQIRLWKAAAIVSRIVSSCQSCNCNAGCRTAPYQNLDTGEVKNVWALVWILFWRFGFYFRFPCFTYLQVWQPFYFLRFHWMSSVSWFPEIFLHIYDDGGTTKIIGKADICNNLTAMFVKVQCKIFGLIYDLYIDKSLNSLIVWIHY